MKLTARQRKFLELASDPEGLCPWAMPKGAPLMKNEELAPITQNDFARYSKEADVWITTPKGKSACQTN